MPDGVSRDKGNCFERRHNLLRRSERDRASVRLLRRSLHSPVYSRMALGATGARAAGAPNRMIINIQEKGTGEKNYDVFCGRCSSRSRRKIRKKIYVKEYGVLDI